MKHIHIVLATLLLACAGQSMAQEQQQQGHSVHLPWQKGPTTVPLSGHATLKVENGYGFLDPAGTRQLDELLHNPSSDTDTYTLMPQHHQWAAYYTYQDIGYVKDDEKPDPDKVLQSYREGIAEGNKEREARGWAPLNLLGWSAPPHYDTQLKSLTWAILLEDARTHEKVVNYKAKVLGRHGVMDVVVVASPEKIDEAMTEFKTTLPDLQFSQGETYADYRPGDRVAEYGLAALITGGAIAVAAKKGFFTVLLVGLLKAWKLVLIALAGAGTWLKSLFKKKQPQR